MRLSEEVSFIMKEERELNLNQQIDYLRRYGETWSLTTVAGVCIAVAVAAICIFIVSNHEQPKVFSLFVAGVSGLIAFAILTQVSNLKRAARATRTGRRVPGILHLTIDRSDSENFVLTGEVSEGSTVWKLYFGRPLGWTPQSGEWACEMITLADDPFPTLVELKQGLLFTTRRSHKVRPQIT